MTDLINAPTGPNAPPLEPCARCDAPLAGDQRWCLNCGSRREGVRTPFAGQRAAVSVPPPVTTTTTTTAVLPPRPADTPPRWVLAALGLGLASVLFALGLVVGLAGQDRRTLVTVPPGKPPVVNVDVQGGVAAAAPVAVEDPTATAFVSDWPDKTDGWTVQLTTLKGDADQAAVDGAKSDAEADGATDVGALLSDDYASLAPNQFVIYSGVYTTEAEAKTALGKLDGKAFKKAKVVEVSESGSSAAPVEEVSPDELEGLESDDPEAQQKASKKLPNKVGTVGTPPPVDDVAPGGGGEGTVIE